MTPNPYTYRSERAREQLKAAQLLSLKNATASEGQEDYEEEVSQLKSVLASEPECTDPIVYALLGVAQASVDISQCTPYLERALQYNGQHHTLDDNKSLMHVIYKYLGLAYLGSYKDNINQIDQSKLAQYYREALRYKHDDKMAAFLAKVESSLQKQKAPASVTTESDTSTKKSGGCFIASAAYGSEFASEVILFKRFRDSVLQSYAPTRLLVNLYYKISPPIADFISTSVTRRFLVRSLFLKPFSYLLKLWLTLTERD